MFKKMLKYIYTQRVFLTAFLKLQTKMKINALPMKVSIVSRISTDWFFAGTPVCAE